MITTPGLPGRATGGLTDRASAAARRPFEASGGLAAGAVLVPYGLALALLALPTGPVRVYAPVEVLAATVLALTALVAATHAARAKADGRRLAAVPLVPEDAPW
jgi:hypothetical protein